MGREQLEIKYLKRLLGGYHKVKKQKQKPPLRITGVCKFLESSMNFILCELYIGQKLTQACAFHILILGGIGPTSYMFYISKFHTKYFLLLYYF